MKCPWCSEKVEVIPGGWIYQRAQVVSHLADCAKRPSDGGMSQLNIAADRVIDTLRPA
ncbi:MAG: hypothetical protein JJE51_10940 [Thermoanaerobaculia bacterium]|nr:hypothetical protein [Thermoanaerobaculia bacterium]